MQNKDNVEDHNLTPYNHSKNRHKIRNIECHKWFKCIFLITNICLYTNNSNSRFGFILESRDERTSQISQEFFDTRQNLQLNFCYLLIFVFNLYFYNFRVREYISLFLARFSNPDRSLNHKNERFKVFEVEPRSNQSRTVMTS